MGRRVFAFGAFELDVATGELRKAGAKIRLAEQPLQILLLLIERAGEVVTRDELRQKLWSADTFVDFDTGLSSAVRKLRDALGDSADNPRFVETLPRRGYRFIAPVTFRSAAIGGETPPAAPGRTRPQWPWVAGATAFVVVMILVALYPRDWFARASGAVGEKARPSAPVSRGDAPNGVNPGAYDAYLRGISAQGRDSLAGLRTSVGYLETAVAKQPDFAMAYAALGQARLQFLYAGPLAPRQVVPAAEAATRKALQLNDRLPLAHRILGTILQSYYWKWEEGNREHRRALALDPASVEARVGAAFGLIRRGRFEEAIVEVERANSQDPLSFTAAMDGASVLRAAGKYDRALTGYRRALELNPRSPRAHFQLGITDVFMRRVPDAITEFETAVGLTPDNMRFQAYLGYAYAIGGRSADARRLLRELEARARTQYVSSYGLALINDGLGDAEHALAAVERAYEDRAIEFAQAGQYPPFQSLRADPRYHALMRRIAGDRHVRP